jgi:hypothetical protein
MHIWMSSSAAIYGVQLPSKGGYPFTIRDVLWLQVVVALLLVLWNERQKYAALEREHSDVIGELNRLQGRRGDGAVSIAKPPAPLNDP